MSVFTVLGAGMMGSALCVPLVDRGHEVRLVGTPLDDELIAELRRSGVHRGLSCALPQQLHYFQSHELERALDGSDVVGLGVSSSGIEYAASALRAPFERRARAGSAPWPVVSIAKGLQCTSRDAAGDAPLLLPDVFARGLGAALEALVHPVCIAGPCIAGELARRVDTCVVAVSRDVTQARHMSELLRTPYYHVFVSPDVVGVEVCAALKNAYAMAIAFAAGLHEASGGSAGSVARHNFESAVFAQSVVEMQTLVRLMGGDPQSASWLPGAGDLDVTTNGGRTGRFGKHLGTGMGRSAAIRAMNGATLECLAILDTLRRATQRWRADGHLTLAEIPLLEHMTAVALDDAPLDMPFERFFGGLA